MAKYVTNVRGSLTAFSSYLEGRILNGSMSASKEDEFCTEMNGVRVCVQVYERYSYMGGNRVSLNVTMVEQDGYIQVAAITSGGSQAMFIKINTFGEEAFLDKFKEAIEGYRG